VNISVDLASVDVMHHGRKVTIKILWYRGGMQDWESLGLSILEPSSE
jgi:hypothetical protein